MKAVIVGGGLSGQVAGRLLADLPFISTITILEASYDSNNSQLHTSNDQRLPQIRSLISNYIGIWSPALNVLKKITEGNEVFEKYAFTPVATSGYKCHKSGDWLMQPSKNMNEDFKKLDHPTLAFVDALKLSEISSTMVGHSSACDQKLQVLYNRIVKEISPHESNNRMCKITTACNETFEADIVIAADGSHSRVRQLVFPNTSSLIYRGYKVFRGVSLPPENTANKEFKNSTENLKSKEKQENLQNLNIDTLRISEDSFQSWGDGIRFACVPCATDTKDNSRKSNPGNQWFAAVTSTSSMPERKYGVKVSPNMNAKYGFCVNGSEKISSNEWIELKRRLQSFHNPVQSLLETTNLENVTACDAIATGSISKGHWSGIFRIKNRTNDSSSAEFLKMTKLQYSAVYSNKEFDTSSNNQSKIDDGNLVSFVPIVFLGDAAHTLDPILAQGAGIALEDAFYLVESMKANVSAWNPHIGIPTSLESFDDNRFLRLRNLHFVSNLSQLIGHVDNVTLRKCRDFILKRIPSSLKSKIFDKFIKLVSM